MKKTAIVLIIGVSFLMQACYTRKSVGNATVPDYNGRVNVSNAGMKKKGNGINVAFSIGLAGAGGFAGYQYLPLVQKQTAEGSEPVRAANAAIGTLSGAALAYLFDAVAGKNKTKPVINPQVWIKKTNPQYQLLNGIGTDFTIIHPSVERNYTVRNFQDVQDFYKMFPNSTYAENVVTQSINNLAYDVDFPALSELYPQYNAQIETAYLQNALEKTNSFEMFKTKISVFPQCLSDVNLEIDYQDEVQLKTLFAQLDSHAAEFGTNRIRTYKNEIQDNLAVIRTNIDEEYVTAQYDKIPKNTSDYILLYDFIQRFPNSKYTADLKIKADNMKYSTYASLFAQIQREVSEVNVGIINNNPVSASKLENLLASYEKFGSYDPDNHRTDILAAKSTLEEGINFSAFFDVKQHVNSILSKAQKQEFVYPSDLSISINKFNSLSGNKTTSEMKQYVADAQGLCKIMEGVTLTVPASYRTFSVEGAMLGVIGTFFSGDVRALNYARPMNTALAEEHLSKVRVFDDFVYFLENNRFGEDELLGHTSRYDEDNVWRILGLKLIDKEDEIINKYNSDTNDKITQYLNQWQGNINSSSSSSSYSSSSSSSSSSSDIDPDKVFIPSYKITTYWIKQTFLGEGDEYLQAKFTDGTEIEIVRYNPQNVPYIPRGVRLFELEYKTDEDAIKAAYVYKKYEKIRTIGKK